MHCELWFVQSYHEAFLRGRPDLTHLIRRLKSAGKRTPNLSSEPNFYEMRFLPRLEPPNPGLTSVTTRADAVSRAITSNGNNLVGDNDQQFERYALVDDSQNYPEATTCLQHAQAPSHPLPSSLFYFPTSSGMGHLGNHASNINRNSYDSRDRFSNMHQGRGSFQRTESGNQNEILSGYLPMGGVHQFSSKLLGNKKFQPHDELIFSDILHPAGGPCSHECGANVESAAQTHAYSYNELNVSSAVSLFSSSDSSRNMAPHACIYTSSSGHNENDLNRRAASYATAASSQYNCNNTTVEPYGGHAQASTAYVAVSDQSIALLSSPTNDPLLEEFAREYLPHFGKKDDNYR